MQASSSPRWYPMRRKTSIISHPLMYSLYLFVLQSMGVWSTGIIPRGTRFGPLIGERYSRDAVLTNVNRKYFWRVISYFLIQSCFFIFILLHAILGILSDDSSMTISEETGLCFPLKSAFVFLLSCSFTFQPRVQIR